DDAGSALQATKDKFKSTGIAFHEVEGPPASFGAVGVARDGKQGRLRHSDHRAWRLHLACRELERPGAPRAAWQIRVSPGHWIQRCLLLRPALSVFRLLYWFVDARAPGPPCPPPAGARREIQLFRGLIFQAVVFLDRPTSNPALCSDQFIPDKRPDAELEDTFAPGWAPGADGVLGETPGAAGVAVCPPPPPARARKSARGVPEGQPGPAARPAGLAAPDDLVDPARWVLIVELGRHDSRALSLGGNMSEMLSIENGRAVDLGLACARRRAAAGQIARGISWRRRHLDTGRSLSKAGSRKALLGAHRPGRRRVEVGWEGSTPSP
ncbi:unnamed protein product, partial [Prorocentrum cordatum]